MTILFVVAAFCLASYFIMALVGVVQLSIQDGQAEWVATHGWTIAVRLTMLVTAVYLFFSHAAQVNITLSAIAVLYAAAYSLSGVYLIPESNYKKSALIEWSSNSYSLITTLLTIASMVTLIILTIT